MKQNQIPTKFPVPFASGAGPSFIRPVPIPSQILVQDGAASMTDGFPPSTFLPVETGGTPPYGQDTNGLLNQVTAGLRWIQAGVPFAHDPDFQTAIGGYPIGATVMSNIVPGKFFVSTVDDNMQNPDTYGAGWTRPAWGFDTGDFTFSFFDDLPEGWVPMKPGYTIGNPFSGATLASYQTMFLFRRLWLQYPNTECPVSGGRGANPLADYNAGKLIQVKEFAGSSIIAPDFLTGRLNSVPVISGNVNAAGAILGENFHSLNAAENGPHTHVITGTTGLTSNDHSHNGGGSTAGQSNNHTHAGSGTSTGQSNGHVHNVTADTGDQSADHQHGVTGGTSIQDADHQHGVTGSTTGQSVTHSHFVGGTTNGMNASNPHNHITPGRAAAANSQNGGSYTDLWNGVDGTTVTSPTNIEHGHTFGVQSGVASTDHSHSFNVNSGGINANHGHSFNVTSGGQNANHHHSFSVNTGAVSLDHTHNYNFTTGGFSADHSHTYNFTTGGMSANHTHDFTTTSNNSGSGTPHNTVQRSVTAIPLMKL